MIPLATQSSGKLSLIPIFSQKSFTKQHLVLNEDIALNENNNRTEDSQYIILIHNLQRFPFVGSEENGCPHCGALVLKESYKQVFAYPDMECCLAMIKQHCEWIWEELKMMSLLSTWTKDDVIKADHLHKRIHYLELRSKVLEPAGGT